STVMIHQTVAKASAAFLLFCLTATSALAGDSYLWCERALNGEYVSEQIEYYDRFNPHVVEMTIDAEQSQYDVAIAFERIFERDDSFFRYDVVELHRPSGAIRSFVYYSDDRHFQEVKVFDR